MGQPKTTIVVGGRWHAFDLARGLARRGALHRLVTNYPWFKVRKWGLPREQVVTVPSSQWANQLVQRFVPDRHRAKFQLLTHRWFAEEATRWLDRADVVHGWSSFSLPSIRQCRRRGVPFVLERGSSHMATQCDLLATEQALLGLRGEVTHPQVVAMELAEYAEANRIAVPSRFVEGTFRDRGVAGSRLWRNTLGVNLTVFRPEASTSTERRFTAVFAGTLSYRKGIHYLVEGFRRAGIADSRLLLVGGATAETDQLIGTPPTGLERLGHVPQAELVGHYRRAHVFAIASIEEGLAMVQAQALACGLPLVCTTNTGGEDLLEMIDGGTPPVVEPGGIKRYSAGFVVPARDPAALAACLQRLAAEPELRSAQARAALRIHESALDWQDYADRALAGYQQLLQEKKENIL